MQEIDQVGTQAFRSDAFVAVQFLLELFQGGEALSQLWLFIVAPFVGAALSAVVWKVLAAKEGK